MSHIDRYDDPKKMWPLIIGGKVLSADDDEVVIRTEDGRTFEVCPDYSGNEVLRINEAILKPPTGDK